MENFTVVRVVDDKGRVVIPLRFLSRMDVTVGSWVKLTLDPETKTIEVARP
jgi:bifunctional DNA-binding transcriptional regulator/antitoxin component of YhaV-PrlF toxin-antitoxin module